MRKGFREFLEKKLQEYISMVDKPSIWSGLLLSGPSSRWAWKIGEKVFSFQI